MIAMACLLPSRATTTEAAKVVMAVRKTAKSTGGLAKALLPSSLSCIAVRRDTKPSAGNGGKSNNAFNFFGFVIVFHLLSLCLVNFRPCETWRTGECDRDTLAILLVAEELFSPILCKSPRE